VNPLPFFPAPLRLWCGSACGSAAAARGARPARLCALLARAPALLPVAVMVPVPPSSAASARSAARALAWACSRSAPGSPVPSSPSLRPVAWSSAGVPLVRGRSSAGVAVATPRGAPSRPRLARGHGVRDAARGLGAACPARVQGALRVVRGSPGVACPPAASARFAVRALACACPIPALPFRRGHGAARGASAARSVAARGDSARPARSTPALPLAVAPCVAAPCPARPSAAWRVRGTQLGPGVAVHSAQRGSRPASPARRSARLAWQLARSLARPCNA
jgi:hypothetical protein